MGLRVRHFFQPGSPAHKQARFFAEEKRKQQHKNITLFICSKSKEKVIHSSSSIGERWQLIPRTTNSIMLLLFLTAPFVSFSFVSFFRLTNHNDE